MCCRYGVFKVHVSRFAIERAHRDPSEADGLSKLNSVDVEVDVIPGECSYRTAREPSNDRRRKVAPAG
jgi:hypothetical protein